MSATCRVRSLTHFPWLQSQARAIIQSPTNSLFGISIVSGWCGFFSALFSKLPPWETGKVKQLTRCHLVNSPWFHTLTNSHVDGLTHTLPLKRSLSAPYAHTHNSQDLSSAARQAQQHTSPSNQARELQPLTFTLTAAFQGWRPSIIC